MQPLTTTLLLASLAALPAAHAFGTYTSVDLVSVGVEFNVGAGIYDPADPANSCAIVYSVTANGHFEPGFVNVNRGKVGFEGQNAGFPGFPANQPYPDPTDCFNTASPTNEVGFSDGTIKTGSSLYFGFNFDGLYSSASVTVSHCPLGSQVITGGVLVSCTGGFTPIALPANKDVTSDYFFLSELALPSSGFLRVCYEGSEWDPATFSFVAKEQQDHVMAVTWDDLVNHPQTAASAIAAGLLAFPVLNACT